MIRAGWISKRGDLKTSRRILPEEEKRIETVNRMKKMNTREVQL